MKQVKIKDVPKGEYIRLKESETSPVWVKGEYCRSEKKYSLHKFDDVNHDSLKKGDSLVYIGFTF